MARTIPSYDVACFVPDRNKSTNFDAQPYGYMVEATKPDKPGDYVSRVEHLAVVHELESEIAHLKNQRN